ncbi:MAG: long-chain fatty acid--CoA ligase [Longilinea sp.]|nr:long-chain fatty acid--CoA ligase [Longilinea sp.]
MEHNKPWLKQYDVQVAAHGHYPQQPLFAFLQQAARRYPQQVALRFGQEQISYAELEELTQRIAAGLVKLGVQAGQRVALMMPNVPQFVVSYYAVLKAGGVVVACNPAYRRRELAYQLNDSGATLLIGLRSYAQTIAEAAAETGLRQVVWTDEADSAHLAEWLHLPQQALPQGQLTLQTVLQAGALEDTLPPVEADAPAVLQYTGGTTGLPKGAVGLHRNLVANTLQFQRWLHGLQEAGEVVLCAIPLFHVYGMVIAMNMGVALAATLVLFPNPREVQGLLETIQRERVSLFPGVPTLYQMINAYPQVGDYDLRSIKACISGSAPLPAETKRTFEALTGGKLLEGYGLSEAPTATHCNPFMGENRTGSIGLPLPDVDCRIVIGEDEQDAAVGQEGELLVRGPQVMAGYQGQVAESAAVLKDGWLHTGDVARMDEDGYFYLVGRKKELIKVSGYQVWPNEVEAALLRHPAVREVGVAGVPHAQRGEQVKAWVVLKEGMQVGVEELAEWCRQDLAYYKVPTAWAFVKALPRSGVGKLLRRELQQMQAEE